MPNVSDKTNSRKIEIVEVALELFLEKGYDGTSIRMIQKKVGKEVGLFYYYFASKDEVFEAAIDLFFESYEEKMMEILSTRRDAPEEELTQYIDYIFEATQSFRAQYLYKLHWSVISAIREHTMKLMKKYIRQILNNYIEKGIIQKVKVDIDVAVNLLAFGIGGSILYQSSEEYEKQIEDVYKLIPMLLGDIEEV